MQSFLKVFRKIQKTTKVFLRQDRKGRSLFSDAQVFLEKCNQPRSYLKYIGSTALVLLCVSVAQVAQAAVTITRTSSPIFFMNDDNTPELRGMYVSYQITNTGAAINDAWVKLDMPVYGAAGIKVTLAQSEDGLVELGPMQAGQTKTAFFYVYTPVAMSGQNGSLAISESHTVRVYEGNPTASGTQLSNSSFTFTEIQDTIAASANTAKSVKITSSQLGDLLTVQVNGDAGTIGSPPYQSFSPAVFADWPASSLELVSTKVTYGATSFDDQLFFNFNPTSSLYTATYVFKILSGSSGSITLSPVGEIASGNQIKHTSTSNFNNFILVNVNGKVWDDANNSANNTFTNINTGTEVGTNAGGLNALLVDSTGNLLDTTPVAADGTYSLSVGVNQSNVTIRLSTTAGTVGSTAPAASVPANWTGTSPLVTAAFNIVTNNITGRDFGIEQLPNTTDVTAISQSNPGSTATVQVATLAGTDPEDGALGTGKSFKIVTVPTNGTLSYPNASNVPTAVTAGQVISNYDPTKLTIDPDNGSLTVSFTYAAVDAAGKADPTPATVSIPFTASSLPDLTLSKTHTGNFTVGIPGTYALKVNNIGNAATTGTTTVTDTLPTGLTIANGAVTLAGTNAANWSCTATGNVITCTSSTAIVAGGNSTFNLTGIQVGATAVPSVTNTATVSGGGQTNLANDGASDATVVINSVSKANVLLVKRITAINGDRTKNPNDNTPLNIFKDDTSSTTASNDNNANWQTSPVYLVGAIDAGLVKPGDEIEYTTYFLNSGSATASNVKICDRLFTKREFNPGVYGGTGKDVELWLGSNPVQYLTSANDLVDRTQFYTPGAAVPTTCNLTGTNTDGTVVLDLTGAASTGNPAITNIPFATGQGAPNNSYGYFRYRVIVK
jgi:uncharacterized repeat protein (TIGR01451 family)